MHKFLIFLASLFSASIVSAALQETSASAPNEPVQTETNGAGFRNSDDAKVTDHYEDFYQAINEFADNQTLVDETMAGIRELTLADEWMMDLETEGPGFIDVYMNEMREPVTLLIEREWELERSQFIELFRKELTADEAEELAALFRTEPFLRLMEEVMIAEMGNLDISTLDLEAQITTQEIEARDEKLGRAAISALSSAERGEVEWTASITPTFRKFNKLQPKMQAIKLELENRPTDPDIVEAFEAALNRALQKNFPEDFPEDQ